MNYSKRTGLKVLLLDDGNRGNFIQSYGIAKRFSGAEIKIVKVKFKGPGYKLPGRKGKYPLMAKVFNLFCLLRLFKIGFLFLGFTSNKLKKSIGEKYDFTISTGSLLAPINMLVSKNTEAYSIQIMLPSLLPVSLFDFLIIPYHDYLKYKRKKKNVIVTLGAPNLIDEEIQKNEIQRVDFWLNGKLKKKLVSIVIGGDDQNYRISVEWMEKLYEALKKISNNFQFYLTTSRRTNENVIRFVKENFEKNTDFLFIEIPSHTVSFYPGLLFFSELIFVTEDSINMISEAASTGKKVIILGVERKNRRKLIFDSTIEKFIEGEYAEYVPNSRIKELPSIIEKVLSKKYKKLNEAKKCVQKILENLK